MVEVGDGGFATEFEQLSYLIYVDRPEHVRAAGGPWAGVARVVEQTSVVLEDGQAKLGEVWRSPAGHLYVAKMGEVAKAMREVSAVARHNGQVMDAAADALDAKQKDFAVLSTAPIPSEARESYARAIVGSLNESYQQAVADFRPVPPPPESDIGQDRPTTNGPRYASSRHDATFDGGSAFGGSAPSGSSAVTTSKRMPSWVPTPGTAAAEPVDAPESTMPPGEGPQLQNATSGTSPDGGWRAMPGGSDSSPAPGGSPRTAPNAQPPSTTAGLPFGVGRSSAGPTGVMPGSVGGRPPTGQQPWQPGRPGTAKGPYSAEGTARPAPTARAGAGQPGAMLGGVPTGAAGGAGRSGWQGYRRPAEPFPTSQQTVVAPVIGAAPPEEPEVVNTDYADEYGNRITIRRPA